MDYKAKLITCSKKIYFSIYSNILEYLENSKFITCKGVQDYLDHYYIHEGFIINESYYELDIYNSNNELIFQINKPHFK